MNDSISEIEKALRTLANLIENYGDAYWPLFERLELELKDRLSRAERLRKFSSTTSKTISKKEYSNEKTKQQINQTSQSNF